MGWPPCEPGSRNGETSVVSQHYLCCELSVVDYKRRCEGVGTDWEERPGEQATGRLHGDLVFDLALDPLGLGPGTLWAI